ncbi:MAG: helix-turn-helix transcriptional regulator [Pseudomonadota bacterium]
MSDTTFGSYLRERRLALRAQGARFSLRAVARAAELEPSYLSKIERGEQPPPSEERIKALAGVLGEDPDVLLALAGKVSDDLLRVIRRRPHLFAELIRQLGALPDSSVLRIVREVRDGTW